MARINSNALMKLENKYRYNGKKLQHKEFGGGSELEWYHFGARIIDPQIGRWISIDPLAFEFLQWSPFASWETIGFVI